MPEKPISHAQKISIAGYLNYSDALAELEVAARALPNDPRVFELRATSRGVAGAGRTPLRNPRNAQPIWIHAMFLRWSELALSYQLLRRYAETESLLDRVLNLLNRTISR